MSTPLRAADIHAQVSWPDVLVHLGIDPTFVRLRKSGPCPACNGTDRYTFDNRKGRGDFICRGCGPGSGFDLLMRVHGWDFKDARRRVLEAAGIERSHVVPAVSASNAFLASNAPPVEAVVPSRRIKALMASSCALSDCADAVEYLASRNLWPLPEYTGIRGHVGAEYFEDGRSIGRFPAIVAPVTDLNGDLVTVHVTYLQNGSKLQGHEPRKILSPLTGHTGCAVRLAPAGDVLGIAEGIETALSAAALDGVPVWAALNTALLAKFEPPDKVRMLRVYADRDEAGLLATIQLLQRLQGHMQLEVRTPPAPHKDFNDQLCQRHRGIGAPHV